MKALRNTALCLVLVGSQAFEASTPSSYDLQRAKTRRPRDAYRGHGTLVSANAKLNLHLRAREGLTTVACEALTSNELQHMLRKLFHLRNEDLVSVYPKGDGRAAAYSSVEDMERHWALLPVDEDGKQRDAFCHEAVMWFIHHLTEPVQAAFASEHTLPLLPERQHSTSGEDASTKLYSSKVTCQACHVGGIEDLGVPEVAPTTEKAKQRRCYTNYKDLFGITCGPCDGVAGKYWGDSDDAFTPTQCEVVAQPEQVPEEQQVRPKLPHQFTVDVVGGSDRFGRTTNPVHDQLPGPIAKLYGQISGKWFMDAPPGANLWLLRHDTTYAEVTENGVRIPLIKPRVSEIHAQTGKQRSLNVTGPMVSLVYGMPSWIPGGCTCIPDPVGVPDISASWAKGLDEMQYMGRIKLPNLEYLNVPIELDHWASWFFHIFMDTNTSVPHYGKAPSRLSSAYAGTAVYANWIMEDPKIRDPDVWTRGIPAHPLPFGPDKGQYCMNTKKNPVCDDVTPSTWPPQGEPPLDASMIHDHTRFPFLSLAAEALNVAKGIAASAAQVFV